MSTVSSSKELFARTTPWKSVYLSIAIQFVIGVEISIYFMSTWPYLSGLDPTANMAMLGWIVAACSLGCSLANPLFGAWNQKTMAVANPAAFGMFLAAIGQAIYALLPLFPVYRQWFMLASRFITGCGAGSLSALRSYLSMASTPEDRLRAISFGTAGFVSGLSLGPVVQAIFTPFGEGFSIGWLVFNMYTLPAYVMVILSLVSMFVIKAFLKEEYAGLAQKSEETDVRFNVVPKFDYIPAMICIYLWMLINSISTLVEVISTPLSTSIFNWKDSEAVTYNAILQAISCGLSVAINILIGYTRIGKIEKRHQILFGLTIFILYFICNYPWFFYSGPLDYIPFGNTSAQIGGCDPNFTWCSETVRIPLFLYIFCYIFFYGIAFPFVVSPSGALFSEILGPRKQGRMQGLYSLGGSFAQFCTPIVATALFEHTGYKYIMIWQLCALSIGAILVLAYYRRLIPLKMKPAAGSMSKYKNGVLYAF